MGAPPCKKEKAMYPNARKSLKGHGSFFRSVPLLGMVLLLILAACVLGSCGSKKDCTEHVYGEWRVEADSTCLRSGSKVRQCEICTKEERVSIPVKDHTATLVEEVPATCISAGTTAYEVCGDCGRQLTRPTTLEAKGHTPAYRVTVEPTCGSSGLRDTYCAECGHTMVSNEGIPPLEHTPVLWPGQAATCTEEGYADGQRCDVCHTVLKDRALLPKLEHTEVVDVGYPAECERDGLSDGTHCGTCNVTITEQTVLPATGHRRVVKTPGIAATCTTDGKTDHVICGHCGDVLQESTVIPCKGHSEVDDTGYAATCDKEGLSDGRHCTDCGTVTAAQTVIPAVGHTRVTRPGYAATCFSEGRTDAIQCSTCYIYLEKPETIPMTEHTPVHTGTTLPTCLGSGYHSYTCSGCGQKTTETIPAKGHSIVIDPAREATLEQVGLTEGAHCEVCQWVKIHQNTIPRLVDYVVKVENSAMGSVNTTGNVLAPGEAITLVAIPGEGYGFLGWFYTNGECASEEATVRLEAFDPDKAFAAFNEIEARFYPLVKLNVTQSHEGPVVVGGGYYDVGDQVTLSYTSTDRYRIEGWYVNGVRVSVADTFVYTVGETETNVEVKFLVSHRLDVSYLAAGGKVELFNHISEDGYVFAGDRVLVKVTPNASHQYLGIFEADVCLATSGTYDYTMPDHDVTLEVRFEAKIFTLHLNTTIEGVTLSGTGSYEAGVLVSVTASEKVGYTFVGWLDASTGEILSSDREYAFEMEARSMTLYAQYEPIKYSVTASASYADITVSVPDGEYVYGDRITLIAPEVVGYHFLGWYIGDVQITSERTCELTVSGDVHVLARYARYHNIYASGSIEGACEIIAPATAYVGQTVTLTAVPNGTGYVFRGWYSGDVLVSDELTFKTVMGEGDVSVEARFEKLYTITVAANKVGAGIYSAPETALAGERVTVKLLSVNNGYKFVGWEIRDSAGTDEREFTFVMPERDVLIQLEYLKEVKITLSANYELYTYTGKLPMYEGESGWIEITNSLGSSLRFDGYFINGECVESGLRYEFVAGEEDAEIVLMFTEFFTLNVWSETEGFGVYVENSLLPAGTVTTIRADDPGEHYVFLGWYTDGMGCVSTDLSYTLEMPASDLRVYAVYERVFTVSVSTNAPSALLIPGEYRVINGDALTLRVEESLDGGYCFVGWYQDGELISTEPTYTCFPTQDTSMEARFVKMHDVTVKAPVGITVTGAGRYRLNDTVTLTVSDTASFSGWYDGERLLSTSPTYQFVMPDNDITLTAVYRNRWDGTVANAFAGGNGTASSPYLISNGAELARLAMLINDTTNGAYYNKYYKLIADIDLGSLNWTPIGTLIDSSGSAQTTRAFQGNFDGNGHTIYNLAISSAKGAKYGYIGLFGGAINATIYDLHLEGVKITASNVSTNVINMGALVGRADTTTISRCSVECTISCGYALSNDMFVGGIVGRSYTATISDCTVSGTVSMTNRNYYNIYLGGVIGYADDVDVVRCISSVTCYAETGKTPCAGGLVGYMQNGTKLQSSVSIGTGKSYSTGNYEPYAGKIYAYKKDSGSTYTNCHTSVTYTQNFFTSTLGFSTAAWDLSHVEEGKLPTLIRA